MSTETKLEDTQMPLGPGGRRPSTCSRRFKIVGNYLYPPLESTQTFMTADIARSENKKWERQAIDQGLIWKGRVVEVENVKTQERAAMDADSSTD
jgi:hypothetical protein